MKKASLVSAALVLASCGSSDTLSDAPPVLESYAAVLYAQYDDALAGAHDLRDASTPLFSGSSSATADALTHARDVWRASRVAYQQTEHARFYDGPIDDPDMNNPEALINSWPLDESTIDYVMDGTTLMQTGIINDPTTSITEQLLIDRNASPGEKNITTGYHAIEFLLWGQDFDPDGPGDRPFTDYVDGMGEHADRRRTYLDDVTALLIADLEQVHAEWTPSTPGNYRARFVALEPRVAVGRILLGMGKLAEGELSGQRIHTPFTTKDQEDEHSCFSDNTVADYTHDVLGLHDAYFGTYTRTDGTVVGDEAHGLTALVHVRDAALDARMRDALDRTLTDIEAWPTVPSCPSAALQGTCPFDQLIRGVDTDPGRMAIQRVINDLHQVATLLAEIATALGITLHSSDFQSM
jgi:putative iron-regulated protein